MKAIFDTRLGSGYNDDVDRYHFPTRYFAEAERTVGDWIIYREPRCGGGREGYVAVAKVERIEPDWTIQGHYYAMMSGYLPFDGVVGLRKVGGFYEYGLAVIGAPTKLGAALQGKSIRGISELEFGAIVRDGLDRTLSPNNALRLGLDAASAGPDMAELLYEPPVQQERRIVQYLQNRKLRDAAFRLSVLEAYDNRCAITGLRMVNGGGRAEAQAAHIWPVAEGGPDLIQNGIALSGTVHWLFDRHLISLTDDYTLLISHNRVPAERRSLFKQQLEPIYLPAEPSLRPYRAYIRRHRERFVGETP